MAYLRGNPYVWSDGECLHLWAEEPDALLDHSEFQAGVAIPERNMDLFAVMRFAELLELGTARDALAEASRIDNSGAAALRRHAAVIEQIIANHETP